VAYRLFLSPTLNSPCASPLSLSKVEIHEAYFSALKTRVEELRPILLKISRREIVVQVRYDPVGVGIVSDVLPSVLSWYNCIVCEVSSLRISHRK
jgi:hypothetical protein